ncbi:MAG: hypothetical protein ACK5Q1_08475 [Limnobacter sp.]|jgi:hypothetical protein
MSKGRQTLVAILLTFACLGFLAPRLEVSGTRLALTDLACILIIVVVIWGPTKYGELKLGFRAFELYYAGILLALGFGYCIAFSDLGSLVQSLRTLLFCLAGISAALLSYAKLQQTLKIVTIVLFLWFTPTAVITLISLASGQLSLAQFMWEYDAGRLTAPHEVSGTSSVPIGYLFSFVFLYSVYLFDTRRSTGTLLVAMIGLILCFLTASRASILSAAAVLIIFIFYWSRTNGIKGKLAGVSLGVPIIAAIGWIILEKTLIDDTLDGSGMQRLGYYSVAVNNLLTDPISLLVGFGVSDALLEQRTGVSFYESLLFNSLAQGGVLLLIPSLGLVIHPLLHAAAVKRKPNENTTRNLLALGAIVFVGNSIGGANFFSLYAYMYFSLLFELHKRKHVEQVVTPW